MLAVNGKEIDLSLNEKGEYKDDYAKEVMQGIEKIKEKYGFPLVIKYPEDRKYETWQERNGQPYKLVEYPAGVPIPTEATANDPKHRMPVKWNYYTSYRQNGTNIEYSPRRVDFQGRFTIQADQADLAFFLLFKSPMCGSSLGVPENSLRRIHFVVENKKAETKQRLESMRREDRIRVMILDTMSEEDINMLCFQWSLILDTNVPEEDKRLILIDYIFNGSSKNKNSLMDEFEEKTASDKDKEIFLLIEKGLSSGVLVKTDAGKKSRWILKDGDKEEDLCGKHVNKTMEESLIAYLFKLPKVREMIEQAITK